MLICGLEVAVYEIHSTSCYAFFFFNDTATTEIYTLSLHDALPICGPQGAARAGGDQRPAIRGTAGRVGGNAGDDLGRGAGRRSEEHTSELQSRLHLVCRLLLEKKNTILLTT